MNNELFCQNLAKLFFAIASIDQKVSAEEVEFFNFNFKKECTISKLLTIEEIDTVLKEFNQLKIAKADAHLCFDDFKIYLKGNPQLFTQAMKSLIWKTSDGIASAYAGKNKSEVIILAKLKSQLLDLPSK